MFQPAMEHVYALMKKDSYTRFIRSEEYNLLMQDAQSHFTKKRFVVYCKSCLILLRNGLYFTVNHVSFY